ncbi:MAG: D-alanyl-D-alanine carboxypeptidase [Ruminococcaceae bacterium]|nr:D-alanyl-D-alanine carboxypeptidase [Oscillospiraceae bacterium]
MKRLSGRFFAIILAVALTVPMLLWLPVSVNALEDPEVSYASSVYLYNLENEKAVYKLNADEKVYPTSTVKLMTGIVALENLKDRLDDTVTVTAEMMSYVSGNNIGLKTGETVIIRDMLGAMLVNGANDAAYVLALTVSESLEDFVLLMNKRANELGAHNTHYTNPTGMHDEAMVTTAADTALIALHAYNLEQFMDFAALLRYTVSETNMSDAMTVYNRNCLLSLYYETDYYYKAARGMNAGSTYEGGYSVVTTATNGDLTYLCVVLGAEKVENTIYSYVNAANLLDWAFESFLYLDVLSPEQIMCEIPVTLATGVDHVTLVARDSLTVYLPADTDIEKEITFSWTTNTEELQAPVKKGDLAGRVTVLYNGDPIGSSDLISTADIERSDMLYGLHNISEFTKSKFFIATLVCIVVFSVAYVFGKAFLLGRRRKNRYR